MLLPTIAPEASETKTDKTSALLIALSDYERRPCEESVWQEVLRARRAVAAEMAALSPKLKSGAEIDSARETLLAMANSGAHDRPATPEDLELANGYSTRQWPGLLAAMLLVPAWQWNRAPKLEKVPSWLWADYTRYLFYKPQGFTARGQADAYAAHYLGRLEELARLARANPGASAVHAALTMFMTENNCTALYFNEASLRRHYELRGQIFSIMTGARRPELLLPTPRHGRRLRIGFLNRHFGSQTETYTTLPTFEQLDPERFEVVLFVLHERGDEKVESYARSRVADFRVLPDRIEERLAELRSAELDVLVFGSNVTVVLNDVALIAAHRVAPLQVVNNSSCVTSGMPEIDLYVSGTDTEAAESAAHFGERLGLVPGPAHAFNYEADRKEPTTTWTRADLGLPEDAVVFVSAANYFKIIPEMRESWARLLAEVPGSCLLLHPFNPNWTSSYPIERFTAEFSALLEKHGVDRSRLVVSSNRFPSRSDVKELLKVGDIYLDTFPFGGVNSLIDPLELGMPVVAWEGQTMRSRMGAALLRQLRLTELIATTESGYLETIKRLAGDRTARAALGERIAAAMAGLPGFMDPLAASDTFGRLLEVAFDELVEKGAKAFRKDRSPIVTPNDVPLDAVSRQMHARGLVSGGRLARAIDYLVAAVTQAPNDAAIWFELADALRRKESFQDALVALEAGLRLDTGNVDGWRMMADLAARIGAVEIAAEARAVLDELAPAAAADDLVPAHLSLNN